tara:strand:+ start:476 stop:943 length:468 start_codon:yes stop_codon:yes gene_type:complete
MERRTLQPNGQGYKLHEGLQTATVVASHSGEQEQKDHEGTPPVITGVPHDVKAAKVSCNRLLLHTIAGRSGPSIFFCETSGYEVEADSIKDGDNGTFPETHLTEVSSSKPLPGDGYYNVKATVTVNGSVHFCIDELRPVGTVTIGEVPEAEIVQT